MGSSLGVSAVGPGLALAPGSKVPEAILPRATIRPAMRLTQLRQRLRALGAAPCHEGRVLRAWVQVRSLDNKRRRAEDFQPLSERHALPGLFDELNALARVYSEHPGEDGSARLLVELADGQTVESVLLLRVGVCVSTQVGCAVGCVICMTGRAGLLNQLSKPEKTLIHIRR